MIFVKPGDVITLRVNANWFIEFNWISLKILSSYAETKTIFFYRKKDDSYFIICT